ncbi:hypothetical protein, partial [Tamlana crocina]|uniref:hypothetical protein n=1 Tax=Tamlana crocina TaxID=393006 RepID=UPI001ADD95FA
YFYELRLLACAVFSGCKYTTLFLFQTNFLALFFQVFFGFGRNTLNVQELRRKFFGALVTPAPETPEMPRR